MTGAITPAARASTTLAPDFVGMTSVRDYGAVAGTSAGNASVVNRGALTTALNAALPGDTVLVTNGSYYCRGGLALSNLRSVTLQVDGTLVAAPEYDDWPLSDGSNYDGFLTFSNADNLTIRGAAGAGAAGVSIDGRGKGWWNRAILPQLFLLQKQGEVENLTSHYVAALGAYRGLYLLNWIYRYATEEDYLQRIVWFSGLVQTALYVDFFYHYLESKKGGLNKAVKLPV